MIHLLLVVQVKVLALVITVILPDRDNKVLDNKVNKVNKVMVVVILILILILITVMVILEIKVSKISKVKEIISNKTPLWGKLSYQKVILLM